MTLPEIDLPKLAGAAGSAVGLIISTAILLSWITTRYIPTIDRFRAQVAELRGFHDEQTRRRELLREQIRDLRRRLMLMGRATCLLCWGMWLAIATIAVAGVALVFPHSESLGPVGGVCLYGALGLDAVAVGFLLRENVIDRRTFWTEAGDLDEVNG